MNANVKENAVRGSAIYSGGYIYVFLEYEPAGENGKSVNANVMNVMLEVVIYLVGVLYVHL